MAVAERLWTSLVTEFRALGGQLENLVMRHGRRGLGLFPRDSREPVRLSVPASLLVPALEVELRGGCLVVAESSGLGVAERTFFERYQRELSWNGGVRDHLWQTQLEWSQLPESIRHTLQEIGWIENVTMRFSPPTDQLCFKYYLTTRAMTYHGAAVLMPFLELINHCGQRDTFEPGESDGIAVGGSFDEEVLVNYNFDDCWGRALTHSFMNATDHALSLAFKYQCRNFNVQIDHSHARTDQLAGITLPRVNVEGDTVRFSHLMLGHSKYPRLPRAIFHHVTRQTPLQGQDELFDLIEHYNRQQMMKFLRATEGPIGPLAMTLREAAYQQLSTLSHHWGTASLEAVESAQKD